jgi:DNA-binding winged helix-turn-helix (wHTH) protein
MAIAPKAFDLLCVLLTRPRQLVSKRELIDAVWPRGFVEEGNLSHNIFLLRRALGDTPDAHGYVVTVPGRGYQFVGEVRSPPTATAPVPASKPGATRMPDALAAGFGGLGGVGGQNFAITTGDFNGDGKLDLAIVNQNDGTVSILLNMTEPGDGSLSFQHAASFGNTAGTDSAAGCTDSSHAESAKVPKLHDQD